MAKKSTIYICSSCGAHSAVHFGKCPMCGEWGTLEEQTIQPEAAKSRIGIATGSAVLKNLSEIDTGEQFRTSSGIEELDRVLGGGIVKGAVVLIAGEPGAGKSTLLLQMAANSSAGKVLYVSGEESASQIKLRADRLEIDCSRISISNENQVTEVTEMIRSEAPSLVIIDSIQTMSSPEISSSGGSISQLRECTSLLMNTAKQTDIPVFIVGHVNKDGNVAGPKVIEHIVDTVLYFEGDKYLPYRILRAAKNRFGSTNEIGVFDMTSRGLESVKSPSQILLDGRFAGISGSCVTCIIEGTRSILAEIQSLVAKSGYAVPRRTANGYDYNRANLLMAVLEKRAGYYLSSLDVYINVVNGISIDDPASDLAVCASIVSSLLDKPLPDDGIAFGEVGLSGEVRGISSVAERVKESVRLGFKRILLPKSNLVKLDTSIYKDVVFIGITHIKEISGFFKA